MKGNELIEKIMQDIVLHQNDRSLVDQIRHVLEIQFKDKYVSIATYIPNTNGLFIQYEAEDRN